MKTYRFHFVRTDYGYIDVQADTEEAAEELYYKSDDENLTKTNQQITEIEELLDDNDSTAA